MKPYKNTPLETVNNLPIALSFLWGFLAVQLTQVLALFLHLEGIMIFFKEYTMNFRLVGDLCQGERWLKRRTNDITMASIGLNSWFGKISSITYQIKVCCWHDYQDVGAMSSLERLQLPQWCLLGREVSLYNSSGSFGTSSGIRTKIFMFSVRVQNVNPITDESLG